MKVSHALTLSSLAALAGLFWLVFILGDVLVHGIGALNLGLFFNDPVPAGMDGGGLRNAFLGQLMITICATLIGVPVGVLGGTFLAEYARRTRYARVISVLADIIVSVPSIVIGTFIYALLVRPFGHFSGWAGAIALSLIMIPVVLRTTEDMLSMVPWTLREAAFALGAPYYKVIVQVVYRGAATGILTGVLLSIARVAGETAPLHVHVLQQQLLFLGHEPAHRVADRHDLSVRHGPLRQLAPAGVGRGVRGHAVHPRR